MALNYHLVPNNLTGKDNDNHYLGVPLSAGTCDMDRIYASVTREGSTITTAETLAVLEEIERNIIEELKKGKTVKTPLFNIGFSIAGNFEGSEDEFDPARHELRLKITPGKRLSGIEKEITLKKVTASERRPEPVRFHDPGSGTANRFITPKSGARLTGSLLKYDPDDPEQGIFFIRKDNGDEIKVESAPLRNKPGELIFVIPDLQTGEYSLEVRSEVHTAKTLRKGRLPAVLTVE